MIIQNKDALDYTNFIYPEFDTFDNYTQFLEYLCELKDVDQFPVMDYSSIAYHMLRYLEILGHCETIDEILENAK